MKSIIKRSRPSERGVEIAEFALMVPLLIFLGLLVSEGAAAIRTHQVLNNTAREGTRLAIQPEYAPSNVDLSGDIKDAMVKYASDNGMKLPSTLSESTPGNSTYIYSGSQSGGWNCNSLNITISQNNLVLVDAAANQYASASKVTVQCGYQLMYLPKLPFGISNVFNLNGSAEFRNLY